MGMEQTAKVVASFADDALRIAVANRSSMSGINSSGAFGKMNADALGDDGANASTGKYAALGQETLTIPTKKSTGQATYL